MTAAPSEDLESQRFRFSTTDPDEGQEFINEMYNATPPKPGRMELASPVSISQVSMDGLSYVDVAMPKDVTLHLAGTDDLSVATLFSGVIHVELGKHTERYTAGEAFLVCFPRGDYQVRCVQFRAGIITVPAAALAQVTADLPGRPGPPLRFDSLRPASAAAAEHWKRAAMFARDLLDDDQAATSPLITSSTARMLAATALTVFPNNALTDPATEDTHDARPKSLQRAITFVDENAHTDIGLADIAAAAHASPRAIQHAFRRHLDMTPLAYLRRVRLDHAHHDLLAADASTCTVTSIAYRWGFTHPGRFAATYQHHYGQPPSTTLHAGRTPPETAPDPVH